MTVLDCVRRIKALRLVPVLFVALLVHTGRAEVPALTWRKPESWLGYFLTVLLLAGSVSFGAVPQLLIDTDMLTDCDDVAALELAFAC